MKTKHVLVVLKEKEKLNPPAIIIDAAEKKFSEKPLGLPL